MRNPGDLELARRVSPQPAELPRQLLHTDAQWHDDATVRVRSAHPWTIAPLRCCQRLAIGRATPGLLLAETQRCHPIRAKPPSRGLLPRQMEGQIRNEKT
ncbi:hypothetical protein VTJ04DRAFT_138 [Mycothermus thermophilus]|uniref:uncharacterized protein n=1 Tax=Humicola insolens TaxID=85995 RepID=UPI0037443551